MAAVVCGVVKKVFEVDGDVGQWAMDSNDRRGKLQGTGGLVGRGWSW